MSGRDKKSAHMGHDPGATHQKGGTDLLLWGSILTVAGLYAVSFAGSAKESQTDWFAILSVTVFDLMNTIWWGIAIGIGMVAILGKVPREFVIAILGKGGGLNGIIRATLGGVLLDLCSHGILMVGAKLYERGASAGQVIAFLVASPWNSFSLTLVLIALIGLKWTALFIGLSLVIAVITGVAFDKLVASKRLPPNPAEIELSDDFRFFPAAWAGIRATKFDASWFRSLVINGVKESRMVLRWILFGVVLAGFVRAFLDTDTFQTWFGPSIAGLAMTVVIATVMEVCSEGSTPIAADLLTRAGAPGNSFAFLMTGVATDYTEIMVLKETTRSWKFSLYLPLITLPQVLVIAWLMNLGST
jgi:uncharacterized membrane protein YraQ (UPF0718 family)